MTVAQPPIARNPPGQFTYGGNQQTIALIARVLATGSTIPAMVLVLMPLLYGTGITSQALTAALTITSASQLPAGTVGPALAEVTRSEPTYRAAYVLNAATRLSQADLTDPTARQAALATESRYLALHRQAQANRQRAARAVDQAANNDPDQLLRWRTHIDDRTTPECRAADGATFYPDQPPAIGYPGMVHPHCRCSCEPAVRAGKSVDQQVGVLAALTH